MSFNPIMLSVPLFFFLIGIELLIDRFQRSKLYRLNDAVTNINMGTSQQTVGLLMKVLVPLSLYELIYYNFALFRIEANWLNYVILFFAYDLCYYWSHRMSHEINLFWSGHVVHHQSEEYNLSVALRQSWFQSIFTAPFYLPLALAGFDTTMLVWVGAINLTYQFWIHTEVIDKMGFLEWFMNTPSHHRVHHGRNPKYIDRNHAGVFIIWDKMFGTFQKEEERPTYGITTPLKSWNPVWANFSHFENIFIQLQHTPGFWNKLKVLFYKPGWRPKEQGGPVIVPEVSRSTYHKFDTQVPASVNRYALFQYFVITAGALVYFINFWKFDTLLKLTGGALIIWAVLNNGALFERKNWLFVTEFIRILVTFGLIAWFLRETLYLNNFLLLSALLSLVSFVWLFSFRTFFLQKTSSFQNA